MQTAREILKEDERDPVFQDKRVSKFVKAMMWDGKKSKAYKVFYEALDEIENETGDKGYDIWKQAIENVMPSVEVRSRRVGGATFQIPTEVVGARKDSLSMKWIIQFARQRPGKTMYKKLANELMDAANNEGGAVKKKHQTHKMAEANKAFSHFKI